MIYSKMIVTTSKVQDCFNTVASNNFDSTQTLDLMGLSLQKIFAFLIDPIPQILLNPTHGSITRKMQG